jgi:hypothetical protein
LQTIHDDQVAATPIEGRKEQPILIGGRRDAGPPRLSDTGQGLPPSCAELDRTERFLLLSQKSGAILLLETQKGTS